MDQGPAHSLKAPLTLLALGLLALAADPWLSQAAIWLGPNSPKKWGGDLKRELELIQQFGAPASVLIALAVLACVDARRLRRALDLALAMALTSLSVTALKVLLGRARPGRGGNHDFVTALGGREFDPAQGPVSPWQLGADHVSDLWSMPSSHTSAACVLAVFLTALYPRLSPFAFGMVAVVAASRVLFGAHYPSDVLVGAAMGLLIARPVIHNYLGVRLLDALWSRLINKHNTPKFPALRDYEASLTSASRPAP